MTNWLVIADIDNTVISSDIDFRKMKKEIHRQLKQSGCSLPDGPMYFTVSELIAQSSDLELRKSLWKMVEDAESAAARLSFPLDDMVDFLKRTRKEKCKVVGLTNNSKLVVQPTLEEFDLLGLFDRIYYREDVPELKPDPSGVHLIMEHFGANPDTTLCIGDAWPDAKAAHAAGIFFLSSHSRISEFEEKGLSEIRWVDTTSPPLKQFEEHKLLQS